MKFLFSWLLKTPKKSAFTLIELLIAMTMLSVIILVISTTVAQIYFQQKKITLRQNFHNESRFIMEKVVQLVRNNTLDYDRYFVEIGPDSTNCPGFQANISSSPTSIQIPLKYVSPNDCLVSGLPVGADPCVDNYLWDMDTNDLVDSHDTTATEEGQVNREILGYENIFYWDTNNDGNPDRQLGGYEPDGTLDNCTQSFHTNDPIKDLYLINGSRTVRTHLQYLDNRSVIAAADPDDDVCDPGECIVLLSRELGRDLDGDKRADEWNFQCDATTLGVPENDITSPEVRRYCQRGQELVNITPDFLSITGLSFTPAPDKDPYLASRVDSVQIQPHVFIDMSFELKNPERFRFAADQGPNTRLQTSASSRVFGNTRY